MEEITKSIAEYAMFFDHYGNYVLIPVIILVFITDWKVAKSKLSHLKKKVIRTSLTISATVLAILIFLINVSFKPMISSMSKVDQAIGTEMVHFEYLNIDSQHIETLETYKNKIILLNFWGTFCPPCIKEFPDLKRLESEFPEDLVVVAISNEPPEHIEKFITRVPRPSIIGFQENYSWINPEKFLPVTIIIEEGIVKERFLGRKTYEELVAIVKRYKN
ncbi:TlpA family protein disulfide reductase [Winogradskyella sp.]|uniref:TlpA family protein disulfide reductase n=1 Tax=Winogradskyella sp. TaxID=1883156 RepID=UPI003BA8D0C8